MVNGSTAPAGRLTIAGLGPGALAQITPEVAAALQSATDVVGYLPYVARARAVCGAAGAESAVAWHASDNRVELDRARQALALAAQGRQVVVVSSGDPGVFAMASAVFEAMENAEPADAVAWQTLDVQVLPGITAMLAASARAGAPLGHDFCCINLSDNLKPWPVIEKRVRLAAEADFAMAFYNPRSRSRPEGFVRLLDLLRAHCEPARLLVFARAVSTPDEQLTVCTLAEAAPEMADMRTVVLVGNSATRRVGRFTYTPRFYGLPADGASPGNAP
ncbi:precorrin-3B C(17)-methyltransferase [Acidovorax sp. sic0104]|uniref:precorrin-3B C(17)-methyltransferase n=1 Tax=Acidovorax sp. sic0104 TaxID=2854784 RepID=UPI001C481439|nr:precorrin-3B C(17)-methyltransferase [Acidovorax sp. sic0104]MBV7544500.1 precorrin-3B C(17)-methyltransferase [Acidovorax sp. sic0104]